MNRKLIGGAVAALIVVAGVYGGTVRATPVTPPGSFVGTTIAKATYGRLHLKAHQQMPSPWMAYLKTKGQTDVYVQSNVWQPGGSTGWHTHPGPSLIIVTAGTVTEYRGDDNTCRRHVYTAGQGFVDPGGSHIHMIRNEGTVEADTVAVQFIPAGGVRRIDEPAPPNCPS